MTRAFKVTFAVCSLLTAMSFVSPAHAATSNDVTQVNVPVQASHSANRMGRFAVGLGVGTEGIGGTGYVDLVPHKLDLNVGFSYFKYSHNFSADNANFDGHIRLGGVPITLSYYPFGGEISLNAGVFVNMNQATVTGTPETGNTYTLNGDTYSASEVGSMSGKTHFHTVAPYLGIGYGNPFDGGAWTFQASAGAVFEGNPNVTLTATGAASNPALANDVKATQASVNSKLSFLRVWPVVEFSIVHRF